jgi:phage terminase small subunit
MTKAATPRGVATGAGDSSKLSPKQLRFVEEYLVDLNASAAFLRAGYKSTQPNSAASKLAAKPSIQAAIAAKRAAISKKLDITVEMALERLWRMGDGDVREMFNAEGGMKSVDALTKEQAHALIHSIKVTSYTPPGEDSQPEWTKEVKFVDRRAALVDVVRILGGMPKEQPDVNVHLNVEMPSLDDLDEKLARYGG